MSGRSFFDTTILIYSISSEEPRAAMAEKLLADGGWISVQVLNEFAAVARRKLNLSWKRPEKRCRRSAFCAKRQPLFRSKPTRLRYRSLGTVAITSTTH